MDEELFITLKLGDNHDFKSSRHPHLVAYSDIMNNRIEAKIVEVCGDECLEPTNIAGKFLFHPYRHWFYTADGDTCHLYFDSEELATMVKLLL